MVFKRWAMLILSSMIATTTAIPSEQNLVVFMTWMKTVLILWYLYVWKISKTGPIYRKQSRWKFLKFKQWQWHVCHFWKLEYIRLHRGAMEASEVSCPTSLEKGSRVFSNRVALNFRLWTEKPWVSRFNT